MDHLGFDGFLKGLGVGRSQGEAHFRCMICHVVTRVARLRLEGGDLGGDTFPVLILPTKLTQPVVDSQCVPRPRLITQLEDGMSKRLTLISAAAGYGKTTLAVQWLAGVSRPKAWLSLDENDDDPDRFLTYLVAAVRAADSAFGATIEPLLAARHLPPVDFLADAVVADLASLSTPLVLTLDDFHAIGGEPVQSIFRRIVTYLPPNIHLLVLTRSDPHWPLAFWRTQPWFTEIRAADLRFSPAETYTLFARALGSKLDDETTELILGRTEGWVAGLQLALLALAHAEHPGQVARDFSVSDRQIDDYLVGEVISRQPDLVRHFLALTALFDRFCASLCDFILEAVLDRTDSQSMIAQIDRENLFIIRLGSGGQWFRYHHLFRNLLRQCLQTHLTPERQIRVHELAGEWFAAQGLLEEALRHFLAAGDVDSAAALLEGQLHAVLDENLDFRILDHWLSLFPKSSRETIPSLMLVQAIHYVFVYNLAGAVSLAEKTEALIRDPACSISETRRQSFQGDIDVIYAFCLYWQGDAEGALQHAERALRLVPKRHCTSHGAAIMYSAFSLALLGRRNEALNLLGEALLKDHAAGRRMAAQLLTGQAIIHTYAGDSNAVRKSVSHMFAIHETAPMPDYRIGTAHYLLGSAAYESNFLDEAENHFQQVEKLRYRVDPRIYHGGLLGLALIALAKGEAMETRKYVSSARQFAIEAKDSSSLQFSNSFERRLDARSGQDSSHPGMHSETVDYNQPWIEPLSLIRADYLIIRKGHGDLVEGMRTIDQALKQAKQHHNTRQVIQFLSVKAVALKCSGKLKDALEVLEEALSMAEPLGFVRTFVDRGPLMAELLRALMAKCPQNPYARSLLDAFVDKIPTEATLTPPADRCKQVEPSADNINAGGLSNRELDVLFLLQERFTRKEIAEKLFISPSTVQAHTRNIYRKLNASGRHQAIAQAKKLGLLPLRQ